MSQFLSRSRIRVNICSSYLSSSSGALSNKNYRILKVCPTFTLCSASQSPLLVMILHPKLPFQCSIFQRTKNPQLTELVFWLDWDRHVEMMRAVLQQVKSRARSETHIVHLLRSTPFDHLRSRHHQAGTNLLRWWIQGRR